MYFMFALMISFHMGSGGTRLHTQSLPRVLPLPLGDATAGERWLLKLQLFPFPSQFFALLFALGLSFHEY